MTPTEREQGMARLSRGFMVPIILGPCDVAEVSYDHGSTAWFPADLADWADVADVQTYVDGRVDLNDDDLPDVTIHHGKYLARLSAPGYMDCTDWTMCDSETAAEECLIEAYDDGADDDTDDAAE